MICPACGSDNIDGVDRCEECMAPFRDLDIPQPKGGLQSHIMLDPVRKLYSELQGAVTSKDPVLRAVELMRQWHSGCVPVIDDGKLVGILSEVDLLLKFGADRRELMKVQVSELMTARPEVLDEDSTISSALRSMSVGGYRHLPVVRDKTVVGILSVKDLLRYLKENLL